MQFLYPIGLLALASVLIPIIIHLWNVKQGKTLKIGSIALLGESARASSKSYKINDLLLFILRCLLLALVAIIITQPFKKNNLSTKNSGWILVERSNFSKVFKNNRKAIDSLTKLGYQIHDFNLGFNLIDLKDTSKTYTPTGNLLNHNSLLNQLSALVPAQSSVYLFTDNRLKNFGNELPAVSYKLVLKTLNRVDTTSNWITNYAGKKFQAVSTPSSTIYTAVNDVPSPVRVAVYETPGHADKQYLLAALNAIAGFSGRKIIFNPAGKADIGFWLSEEPVSANFKSAIDTNGTLFEYAKGKVIAERSFININGIKVALYKRTEATTTFDKKWTDGFGNSILSLQETEKLKVFHLYTRFNPQWNQLVWNEVFVKALMPMVIVDKSTGEFGFEENAADQRQIAPKQRKFTQTSESAITLKANQEESISHIFWLAAFLILLSERILSFRKKANVYVKN